MIHNNSSLPKAKRELSNNELHIVQVQPGREWGAGGGGASPTTVASLEATEHPFLPWLLLAIGICSTQSPPPSTDRGSRAQLIQFRWQTRFRFRNVACNWLHCSIWRIFGIGAGGIGGNFQGDGAARCRCQARPGMNE